MKVEIVKSNKESRIPEVGEAWRYLDSNTVFVRIDNVQGRRAISDDFDSSHFYNLDLTDYRISFTKTIECKDIEILEPVDGVMKFKPID